MQRKVALDTAPVTPGQTAVAFRPDLHGAAVQREGLSGAEPTPEELHAEAARGIATPASTLPHLDAIQRSFGRHDVAEVKAHVGELAAASAEAAHAEAYTVGDHVVLGERASLHTTAHEAAHVVQQRSGVQLQRGVGQSGDAYERHADAVADRVVAGESAESLLDRYASEPAAGGVHAPVQRKNTIVDNPADATNKNAPGTGEGQLQESSGKIAPMVRFGGLHNDCGTEMEAVLIPSDDMGGTEPKAGTWPSWWAAAAPADTKYWVRGHLLNHNLGGPGEKRNLTPITKKANSQHHSLVEKAAKLAMAQGKGLYYKVTAKYDSNGPGGLKGDAYDPNKNAWPKLTLGFQCELSLIDPKDGAMKPVASLFIDNKR